MFHRRSATHYINEHPGPGGRQIRTVLAVMEKDGVPFFHLYREMLSEGSQDWEPLITRDGHVKLRMAEMLQVVSLAAKAQAAFMDARAGRRRTKKQRRRELKKAMGAGHEEGA